MPVNTFLIGLKNERDGISEGQFDNAAPNRFLRLCRTRLSAGAGYKNYDGKLVSAAALGMDIF
jgi:hypothetical protein